MTMDRWFHAIRPQQLAGLWFAMFGLTVISALMMRRIAGRPVFKPTFPQAELEQRWCSGNSSRGLMGRLAWANNCLWIVVARDGLHVGLHFPFNLFTPRFMIGFDVDVPPANITSVERRSRWLGPDIVRVTYRDPRATHATSHVDLAPRDVDRLVRALETVRGPALVAPG